MKSSHLLLACFLCLITFDFGPVSALTPLEIKGVKIISSLTIDTTPPSWTRTLDTTDLRLWLEILPSSGDRVYDEYIVMPELGIVSPVIYTPSTDPRYKDIVEGRNLDVNEFLKQGVHHYPGTSLPGFEGNALIGGHSNFFKNQATDFTSIFHNLPMLDSGDVVWYYKRATPESWMRYVYIVTQSYETKSDDARVFDPIGSGVEMTFYTCVPIGTADNRWIVRTQLESSQQVFYPQTIESYDNFVGYQDLDEATQAQLRALIESGASDDEIQALITSGLAQQKTSGDIADVPEATVVASLPWWKQLRQWFVRLLSSSF